MVTELDHDAIKARIVAILKDNSAIFTTTPSDLTRFRVIEKGAPDFSILTSQPFPHCWVTNDDIIEDDIRLSQITGNQARFSIITFNYLIIFAVQGKDGGTSEKLLDDFAKEVKQTIKANYQLVPVGGGDNLVRSCWPVQQGVLNRNLTGTQIQGRVIRLKLEAHTS